MYENVPLKHPWQNGPTELICYAIEHLYKNTDFDKRIAYLLLDVGVETLLKTYLILPEEKTGAIGSFFDRRTASEGNFHNLVEGVVQAAGSKLDGIDMSHIEFYHGVRNKLYHQGNGITVPTDKAQSYTELAVRMLNILLDVDLSAQLDEPERLAKNKDTLIKYWEDILNRSNEIRNSIDRVFESLPLVIEQVAPSFILPSSKRRFNKIYNKHAIEEEYFETENTDIKGPYYSIPAEQNIQAFQEIRELIYELIETSPVKDTLIRKERRIMGKNPISGEWISLELEVIFLDLEFPPQNYENLELNIVRFGVEAFGDKLYQAIFDANLFLDSLYANYQSWNKSPSIENYLNALNKADIIHEKLNEVHNDIKTFEDSSNINLSKL